MQHPAPQRGTADSDGGRRSLRRAALAQLEPLIDIRGAFARGFDGHEHYDVLGLAEAALHETFEGMGLVGVGGRERDEVVAAVADVAVVMHDDRDAAEDIAEWVVRWLTNTHKSAGRARTVMFRDPDRGWQARQLDVTWLVEDLAVDGDDTRVVLRASPTAVNAMLRHLANDLASQMVMHEALLDYHMEAGNLDRALENAEVAAQISAGYTSEVRQLLDRTRRDVGAVDWSDQVPQMLDEVRAHLERRRPVERHMRERAERLRDEQTDSDRREIAAGVATTIRGFLASHDQLLLDLLPARQTFLDEQRRQRFATRREPGAVAIRGDLLQPLAALPWRDAGASLDGFASTLVGAVVAPAPSLEQLVGVLLAERREVNGADTDHVDVEDLEDLDVVGSWDAQAWDDAGRLLDDIDVPTRLSQLLDAARQQGVPTGPVVALAAAQTTFARDPDLVAHVDGSRLDDREHRGDDVLFVPTAGDDDD